MKLNVERNFIDSSILSKRTIVDKKIGQINKKIFSEGEVGEHQRPYDSQMESAKSKLLKSNPI